MACSRIQWGKRGICQFPIRSFVLGPTNVGSNKILAPKKYGSINALGSTKCLVWKTNNPKLFWIPQGEGFFSVQNILFVLFEGCMQSFCLEPFNDCWLNISRIFNMFLAFINILSVRSFFKTVKNMLVNSENLISKVQSEVLTPYLPHKMPKRPSNKKNTSGQSLWIALYSWSMYPIFYPQNANISYISLIFKFYILSVVHSIHW